MTVRHRNGANGAAGDRVTIVAFDGMLADTIPLRATALSQAIVQACAEVGVAVCVHDLLPVVHALMPGRTFQEAMAAAVVQLPMWQQPPLRDDVTMHDLAVLRAQRAWSTMVAQGVPWQHGALTRLHAMVAQGVRVVVRSDSQRHEVEPVLRQADLIDGIRFLCCADDPPRKAGVSMLQTSHEAIDARLSRLGVPRAQRDLIEGSEATAAQAAGFAAISRARW